MTAENILNADDAAAVRDAANKAHDNCVNIVTDYVDHGIRIGLIQRSKRRATIAIIHMRRLDALLRLLDKANSIK